MEKVTYIIPVCNTGSKDNIDRENILRYIYSNICSRQRFDNLKIVIGEQPVEGNITFEEMLGIPCHNDVFVSTHSCSVFNKAWIYNYAAKEVKDKTDSYIFAEADIYPRDNCYIERVVQYARKNNYKWMFCYSDIYWFSKSGTESILHKDKVLSNSGRLTHLGHGGAEGGMVWFDKDFFWSIGGYNEWMQKMNGEDCEIVARARYITKNYPSFKSVIFHLYHDKSEMKKTDKCRKTNVEILKYTKKRPDDVIKFLKSFELGYYYQSAYTTKYIEGAI